MKSETHHFFGIIAPILHYLSLQRFIDSVVSIFKSDRTAVTQQALLV